MNKKRIAVYLHRLGRLEESKWHPKWHAKSSIDLHVIYTTYLSVANNNIG